LAKKPGQKTFFRRDPKRTEKTHKVDLTKKGSQAVKGLGVLTSQSQNGRGPAEEKTAKRKETGEKKQGILKNRKTIRGTQNKKKKTPLVQVQKSQKGGTDLLVGKVKKKTAKKRGKNAGFNQFKKSTCKKRDGGLNEGASRENPIRQKRKVGLKTLPEFGCGVEKRKPGQGKKKGGVAASFRSQPERPEKGRGQEPSNSAGLAGKHRPFGKKRKRGLFYKRGSK